MNFIYKDLMVNERLFVSDLIDAFGNATKQDDIEKVVEILRKVEIKDKSAIEEILKELGFSERIYSKSYSHQERGNS